MDDKNIRGFLKSIYENSTAQTFHSFTVSDKKLKFIRDELQTALIFHDDGKYKINDAIIFSTEYSNLFSSFYCVDLVLCKILNIQNNENDSIEGLEFSFSIITMSVVKSISFDRQDFFNFAETL